jgi:holliday junction DNA helicase RuvA
MIGYLRGKIIDVRRNELWLDVHGVGYRVRVTQNKEYPIENEESIELYIHTAVREDAITLYGFLTMEELALFEMLIEVSGVGPKTAIEIVGAAKSEDIEAAIAQADVGFFSRIKGIGKKSAQRIIIDLKNKIGSLKEVDLAAEDEDSAVFMALKQFGFKSGEIQAVMKKMDQELTEQEQVKLGLKMLGKTRV